MGLSARLLTGAAALALGITTMTGCSPSTPGTNDDSVAEVLRLGAREDLDTFDVTATREGHQPQYIEAVYDTLLRNDPDGNPQPCSRSNGRAAWTSTW